MPTVEERLAALEKQMAAWMDQRPTNYYTHQYSGEEIDAATGRALTGGALDTSVTNVSNQLGTYVRPNLLDNWYFGRPVDQRGGYISLQGVPVYNDAACTSLIGNQIETAATCIKSGTNYERRINGQGGGFVKAADVVRGYVPAWNGYSIDRWSVESDSEVVITFVNGGIHVKNTSTNERQFKQILPSELSLVGRMVTISALVGDVIGSVNYVLTQTSNPYKNSAACTITTNGLFSASGSVLTGQQKIVFGLKPGAEITILAAKLELGPTQTLAHQDAAGNWVLNEVPEYGGQLRRCWRYYINSATFGVGEAAAQRSQIWPIKSTSVHYCSGAQFPVAMRTTPAVTIYSAVNGTKNAISNALNGTDSPATASAAFVGSDGFHQISLQGDDSTLDQSVACYTYIASADL